MSNKQTIDRLKISLACIEFAKRRLRKQGIPVNQQSIADEIGVKQPFISQCLAKEPRALSYDTIQVYSKKLGKSLGELCMELVDRAASSDGVRPPCAKPTMDFICRVKERVNFLKSMLLYEKPRGDCNAEKFYGKTVTFGQRLLADEKYPILATMVCLEHAGHAQMWIAKGNDAKPDSIGAFVVHPSAPFLEAMTSCWTNEGHPQLMNRAIVTRPGVPEDKACAEFWNLITAQPESTANVQYTMYLRRIAREEDVLGTGDHYYISLIFLFPDEFEADPLLLDAISDFGDVIQRIYSIEVKSRADAMSGLSGIVLLPEDTRPHDHYYPAKSPNLGQLEAMIQELLSAIADEVVEATALDLWPFDWTVGGFKLISPYFNYVPPRTRNLTVTGMDGKPAPFADAYRAVLDAGLITPGQHGKSNFILVSRRPIEFEIPARESRPKTGLEDILSGSVIGIPVTISDRMTKRKLYCVLYIRCRDGIRAPAEVIAKVQRVAKSHTSRSEGDLPIMEISIAPPLRSVTGRQVKWTEIGDYQEAPRLIDINRKPNELGRHHL